jgi:hypothetical protein
VLLNGFVKTFYPISNFRAAAAKSTIVQSQLFKPRHIPLDGESLPATLCLYHPVKYQHILISNNLYLCIFELWVLMMSFYAYGLFLILL